jgi:SSS family solute:Na+ symporter
MPEFSQSRLHWIDLLIVVGYLVAVFGIGVFHARRQKNLGEFFLAGRELRWLVLGLSLLAALNSGLDYLMQPSAMIQFGAAILTANLTWFVLLPYVFRVTLPLYRRLGVVSAYDYLERRFDLRVRTLAATIFILWRMGWMATALYVPALVVSATSGGRIPAAATIVVVGLVITSFAMLGGIRAVIWNEVLQCVIMFLGLTATVFISIRQVDGGLLTIVEQLRAVGNLTELQSPASVAAGPFSYFYIPMTAGGMFIAVLVARLTTYTCDQVMVQRFQTSLTVADARRGMVLTAIGDITWMIALGFVGLALFAFFQAHDGGLPDWAAQHPDGLFPFFITEAFPIGLTGLIIAAIMAASISSIGCAINSVTSVVAIDFIERLYQNRSETIASLGDDDKLSQVRASRAITAAVGLIGILIALQVSRLGSLLEISNKLINSFTGPLLGIYLLGMFTRRATWAGALIGGAVGTLVTVYFAFQAEIFSALNAFLGLRLNVDAVVSFLWPSAFGLLSTIVVGYLASLATYAARRNEAELWVWTGITGAKAPE